MMEAQSEQAPSATWFVGATFGGTNDQLARFLSEGIWENGYDEKYQELVRSMRPGERIAVKSSYTRKHDLPFDNRGETVSVMAIKATGTIIENLNDGKHVRVDWAKVDPPREWYFHTQRGTVWRVLPGDWKADALIAFAFDGKLQELDRFVGSSKKIPEIAAPDPGRFAWTKFYEQIADRLLPYRYDRSALVAGIREISSRIEGLGHLKEDHYTDGTVGFVKDICPFTVMGLFNRGITESNRKVIAAELARFLRVEEPVPESFESIPLLNNLKSWYFPFENIRPAEHIDALWSVFAAGLVFADSQDDANRASFAVAFDNAIGRRGVAWNLTFGLYWIRPQAFLSLDRNSRIYLTTKLGVPIGRHGPKRRCNAADYLAVMETLEFRFKEATYPVHSYPELSLEAWLYKDPAAANASHDGGEALEEADSEKIADDLGEEAVRPAAPSVPYAAQDILEDGCFLDLEGVNYLLDRLRVKKNLILQGPPGTGKTWLARRLAFALIGQKNDSRVRSVQFHPNLSYEDFVRGWRPTGDGKLSLVDGIFMESIKAASAEAASTFVVVIEEINRGNPAQIFGELLTLLDAGKRTPKEALELCYPDADGKRRSVHIPQNLYVVGTMNVADRSLALVDLALRRRFAFADLEPTFGQRWRDWVVNERGVDAALVADLEARMGKLNEQIASDARLGKQYRIGHSYVTPDAPLEPSGTKKWFQQVIKTEIGPLLQEYWFDAPQEAHKACERLMQGW